MAGVYDTSAGSKVKGPLTWKVILTIFIAIGLHFLYQAYSNTDLYNKYQEYKYNASDTSYKNNVKNLVH